LIYIVSITAVYSIIAKKVLIKLYLSNIILSIIKYAIRYYGLFFDKTVAWAMASSVAGIYYLLVEAFIFFYKKYKRRKN
jgi:hypothetical protein